jgi:AbiU2
VGADIENVELKIDLASRNCCGAIRAFCNVFPILTEYKSSLLPDVLTDLVHHTIRSGLMCLCRVWDKRLGVESLHNLMNALQSGEVTKHLSKNLVQRLELERVFADSIQDHFLVEFLAGDMSDEEALARIISALDAESQSIKGSHNLSKLFNYRHRYLAHTTTKELLTRDKIITEGDYRAVLDGTISYVDKLLWLSKDYNGHLKSFYHLTLDDAHEEWLILYKMLKVETV